MRKAAQAPAAIALRQSSRNADEREHILEWVSRGCEVDIADTGGATEGAAKYRVRSQRRFYVPVPMRHHLNVLLPIALTG